MRHLLFRKTKSHNDAATSVEDPAPKPGGKGRPTPSRKEAEAARRERLKAATDKKAAKRQMRQKQAERNRMVREGMKRGDEKFLMPRDQGPVRRYIRDWIDSRVTFVQYILPVLILVMVLIYSGNETLFQFGTGLQTAVIFLAVIDILWMNFRLKRELKAKFPGESLRGTTFYAILRAMQLRFMRIPKPKVKIGEKPS